MSTEWIIIETLAVLVESFAVVYLLNSRYESKYETKAPEWLAWILLVVWGLILVFSDMPISDTLGTIITYGIGFAYLLITKYGRILYKVFGILLVTALSLGITLAGIGLVPILTGESIEHYSNQDSTRLLALILIKAIQVTLFYLLSKKQLQIRILKKNTLLSLTGAVFFIFSSLLLIFLNISQFNTQTIDILAWLSAGLLIILIGIFYMYEMFAREEAQNIRLSENLQRINLEKHFYKELDAIYSDLRIWQHEYKNNLLVLQAHIANGTLDEAMEHIKSLIPVSIGEDTMLKTGNLMLDAVVSSKLRLAKSLNIDVDIHAVYPENCSIETNDLCAILGNILDNAIEACERMETSPRYISFSLLIKGKNLAISVTNSYDGIILRDGNRYITSKDTNSHGIGITYVDSIVDKNKGHVFRSYESGVFKTQILLPLV